MLALAFLIQLSRLGVSQNRSGAAHRFVYYFKAFKFIHSIPCIVSPFNAMAPPKWQFITEDDPWSVSRFISAALELFLSILLFVGAAISLFTSRFVKFFRLEPPCTYIGCAHPLYFHSEGNQEKLSLGIRCEEDHPPRSNTSTSTARFDPYQDCRGSLADNGPWKQRSHSKRLRYQGIAKALSNDDPRETYPALPWAGFDVSGSAAKNHHEMLQVPSAYQDEKGCEETHIIGQDYVHSSSSSSLQRRRGRSKRPRRRDFVSTHSNKKLIEAYPTLLSTGSNLERKVFKADKSPKQDMVLTRHLNVVHTVIEDAVKKDNLVDVSNTEINASLKSADYSSETNGGSNTGNRCNLIHVSANSEQERDCQGPIIPESFSGHGMALAVKDANKTYSSRLEKIQNEESLLDCLKETNTRANVGKTEHSCKGLLACDDNQYTIQFGSILAKTCIKHEITNAANGDADNFYTASVARIGNEDLQEDGCKGPSTEGRLSKSGSLVFDAASYKSLNNSPASNDLTMCAKESYSAQCFKGTSAHTQNTPHWRSSLEDDEGKGTAILDDKQEEDLDALKSTLQAERLMLAALEAELESERNSAAVATNEAMAMIARLHEEKSAMQMEVYQLQRMSAERADYDEHAISVLKEILIRRDAQNIALEKEVEMYRERVLAGDTGEPHGVGLNEPGSPTLQSHQKLLPLTGQDLEYCSPVGQQPINTSQIPQSAQSRALEGLNTIAADQSSDERLRGFHDGTQGLFFEQSDYMKQSIDGPREIYEQVTKMCKRTQISDGETLSPESAPSAKRFQEHPEGRETENKKPLIAVGGEDQHRASDSETKRESRGFTKSCGAQFKHGMNLDGGGQEDGGCSVSLPIHDVYEVYSFNADRGPPSPEIRGLPEMLDGEPTDKESWQRKISSYVTEIQQTFKPITVSEEISRSPASIVQESGWDTENSFHAEDLQERHALPTLSMVSKDMRQAEMEDVKQLEARLKALEEDQEFRRGTVESSKHRDAELSLLQEISKHLQEVRAITYAGVSGSSLSEEISVLSPSRTRPLKKRRFCSGIVRAQASSHHQTRV